MEIVCDNLLFNLQTIASIEKGRKITTAQEFINVESESFLQPIWRTIHRDSRDKAILSICETINHSICITTLISESIHLRDLVEVELDQSARDDRLDWLKKFARGLSDANFGITNLAGTYFDDVNVLARLKPVMCRITAHSSFLSKVLADMGEYAYI